MRIPYSFLASGSRGGIKIEKIDNNPDTRFLLYTERGNQFGYYTDDNGCTNPVYELHRLAQPKTFEYHDASDGRYYRLEMAEIREAVRANTQPIRPEPLEVRWHGWYGESATEIKLRLRKERQNAVAQAIRQAKARKDQQEEQERRDKEEQAKRESVESQWNSEQPSLDDEIAKALAEAGLSEWK